MQGRGLLMGRMGERVLQVTSIHEDRQKAKATQENSHQKEEQQTGEN